MIDSHGDCAAQDSFKMCCLTKQDKHLMTKRQSAATD